MQWAWRETPLLRMHTALAEALGPLPAPHGIVYSCLQLQRQRDPVPLASLGTGAYIPTHQHTQIHTLKNNKKISVFFFKENKRSDTRLCQTHGSLMDFCSFFLFVRSKPDANHFLFEL